MRRNVLKFVTFLGVLAVIVNFWKGEYTFVLGWFSALSVGMWIGINSPKGEYDV